MNIVVRRPQSRPRVQACKQARGISSVLFCPKLTVCNVSVGTFHAAQSYLGPPSRGLHGYPRIRPDSWTSIQHGAPQNVFDLRPQNFAARHGRLLPVRATRLSDVDSGASCQRRRRDGFNLREVDIRPDQTIRRASRFDDLSLWSGLSRRSSSINPPVGGADHRARQAG